MSPGAGPDSGRLEPTQARLSELSEALERTGQRIASACAAVGRDPARVTLVAVTKYFPAADVVALHRLGVRDVAESRDQEAAAKVAALRASGHAGDLRWHMVGRLQTNKARSVVTYAQLVHSVDRPQLLTALDAAARRASRELDILLQVSLDSDSDGTADGRGGARPQDLQALAAAAAGLPGVRLRGLMALAPRPGTPGADPERAFAQLDGLARALRSEHPDAVVVSAGMSGDLEAAVAAGATHVRVGSALLGERPPPSR